MRACERACQSVGGLDSAVSIGLHTPLRSQRGEEHMLLLFGSAAPKHSHQQQRTLQHFFFFQLIESSKYAVVGSENERCVIAETKHLSTGTLRWP